MYKTISLSFPCGTFRTLLKGALGAACLLSTLAEAKALEADGKNYFLDGKYIFKIGDDVAEGEAWLVGVRDGAVLEGELTLPGSTTINGTRYTVTGIGHLYPAGLDYELDIPWYDYEAAFRDRPGITKVNIPSTIRGINQGEFLGCTGIAEFHVNPANRQIRDENGILFVKYGESWTSTTTGWNLFRMPPATKKTKYTIPSDIDCVRENAFADNRTIKSIILSGKVLLAPRWSDNNLGITRIDVAASDVYEAMGEVIYYKEGSMVFLQFPEGKYTVVAAYPPALKSERLKLPSTVRYIDKGAFACTSISQVELPEGLKDILPLAFYRSKIKSLEVNTDPFMYIDDDKRMLAMCLGCEELESVSFTGGTEGGLTLNYHIFRDCGRLGSFSSTRKLGLCGYAFYGCESLTSFAMSQVSVIYSLGHPRARCHFAYSGLKTIRIPSHLTSIPEGMFLGSRLESVNLDPSGKGNLSRIGKDAFRDCGLSEVNLARVHTLESGSFAGNPLKKVVFPTNNYHGDNYHGEDAWIHVDAMDAFTPAADTWFYLADNEYRWTGDDYADSRLMDFSEATFVSSSYICRSVPRNCRLLYGPAGCRYSLSYSPPDFLDRVKEMFTIHHEKGRLAMVIEQSPEAADLDFEVTSVEIGGVEATREGNLWSVPGKGDITSKVRRVRYTVNGVPMQTVYPEQYDAGTVEISIDGINAAVTAIYRIDGAFAGRNVGSLEPGVYLVVYSDGTRRKILVP